MPSLLSLSNELLLHIASYFKYHDDINSFMRITGRLYYLLRTNLYRHGIDRDKSSALEWAAKHGMESAVQRMINLGAISKTTKHKLWFISVQALKNKHGGVVKLLLENGVEAIFNQTPQEWTYPACLDKRRHLNDTSTLFMALISGCESTLRVMLAHELKEGSTGKAASKGDLTIERFFTDHLPLIVNRRTNGGSTPLVDAVRNGTTEAVRFLLSVGADPNMSTKFYSTALQMARSKRNIEAFRLLLENGASPKRSWEDWYWDLSSLSTQDDKKWDVEATSLLLKHSKMRNRITDSRIDQGMLLITAVKCGCTPVVRQILEKGSHEDDRPWGSRLFLLGSKKPLPLTTAVEWGYMDMIALLLDYGADPAPYMKDWPCTSPLNTAIARDRVDIVKMLMDRGVGLEVHRRRTMIHWTRTCLAV